MKRGLFWQAVLLIAAAHLAHADTILAVIPPSLVLIPSGGVISGLPGSTIGWGYTITNTTDWLVITSAGFEPSTDLGTYIDYTQFNFIVVGPAPESESVTQIFNPLELTGAGSFTIDADVPGGTVITGEIVMTYDLFSVDPNSPSFNPYLDTISTDNPLPVFAEVQVTSTPEPATWLGMLTALVLMGIFARRAELKPRAGSAVTPLPLDKLEASPPCRVTALALSTTIPQARGVIH